MSTENTVRVFQKSITLGNIIQILVIIIGGAVGYSKLEWRITQLEEVKREARSLLEQMKSNQDKLSESVTRLITLEEIRQKREGFGK